MMPATTNPDISAAQLAYLQALQQIIAAAQADAPTMAALSAIQTAHAAAQPTQLVALQQAQQAFFQACQQWRIDPNSVPVMASPPITTSPPIGISPAKLA